MYSFGRVMFHLLTLIVPWHDINEYNIVQRIQRGEVIPRPEISKATSNVTDAQWNHIEQCWSIHPSIRPSAFEAMGFLKREQEALKQDSLAGPLNVLLFGETGVGKSAIINLIVGNDVVETSPDAEPCTLQHPSHEVNLRDRSFKLWEVSSIDSMGFFRASFTKQRLKTSYNKLYKDEGVYLLLYCMRGSRAQRALIRDYKFFTDVVGSSVTVAGGVKVAAVVTNLEDYPTDMDRWWVKNKDNLESLGMRFTAHACITSLPDHPNASPAIRARRHRSKQAIRSLIYNSYQAGAKAPHSSSPAPTV
ncbi:hypothetical protein EDD22DRAFT_808530 [Suillus occidentalis]|nr:hypothetical protein EDD22DRAFT_808530 [Suillus occidentalis]